MKFFFGLFVLALSFSSFAIEKCELKEIHYQAGVRCLCSVARLSCESVPGTDLFAQSSVKVNCGKSKAVSVTSCKAGSKVEVLNGESLHHGEIQEDNAVLLLDVAGVVN